MSDSAHGTSGPCVSIDACSQPIAGYTLESGEAVIETVNQAFSDAFGSGVVGRPIREVLQGQARAVSGNLDDVTLTDESPPELELKVTGAGTTGDRYQLRHLAESTVETAGDGCILLEPKPNGVGLQTDSIASIISHDLRNPLDVAKAHLRAARDTGKARHFDEIEQSHDRIERIIGDVLTLARGRQAIDVRDDVDVGQIATDAWTTVDTETAALSIADTLPAVAADPDRLRRLFENLFRNSVEHAANHESAVQVTVGPLDDGFYVADDGRGIPADEQHRVLEPGYSASGAEGGTGLGLTIVDQIADAHGWQLEVAASSAGGARFEFHWSASDDRTDA